MNSKRDNGHVLWDMKCFYDHYCNADSKLRRCVAVLPWRHNLLLIEKVKSDDGALINTKK